MSKCQITVGEHVVQWVKNRLIEHKDMSEGATFGQSVGIGITRSGHLEAGFVFFDYSPALNGGVITGSAAIENPRCVTKEMAREVFRYPFEMAKCVRINSFVAANNKHAIRFNERLGFKKEGIMRKAHDGKTDVIVFGMLKDELKFKGEQHGQ